MIPNTPFGEVLRPAPTQRRTEGRATFARLEYGQRKAPLAPVLAARSRPPRRARIATRLGAAFVALARLLR